MLLEKDSILQTQTTYKRKRVLTLPTNTDWVGALFLFFVKPVFLLELTAFAAMCL